ncbi:MAG: winged helix-turn-helix transcriptional regulator, partial [Gemmataceae bacterium]|nr:winged helix-turn-helix transcriptional regulator [Gemmataceae bacterium]
MEPDPLQPQMCAKRLAALAAPERLRIVRFLRDGPRNAGAIAAFLQIAAVNVSHHMNVLRTAGLVQSEKRGRFVLYSLVPARPTDAARRKQLLTDLGSARFAVRQKAMRELDALGDRSRAALRGWLGENPPLEVRQRIEQLLARLDGPQDRPEWLRGLRA